MRLHPLACSIALACTALHAEDAPPAKPDDAKKPGHSLHGEAFNEGPRQAAVLMPGTGDVHFPVTTKNELAQKFFTQGVGQLHGFWYFEAERSFRQAAALDAECAMAYWGMAMANVNNQKRAMDFMKTAVAKKGPASRREQVWIDTWAAYFSEAKNEEGARRAALVKALEELVFEFPDDLEAKAFLVYQLWDNSQHGSPLPSRLTVDALAQQVLAANPAHPVHHYLIHLWNVGEGDKHALAAAARCGQAAPAIAHMWHMSGHTFSKLRRYADATWQQEASARVDHAYMAAARILPEQIHNYAHNNDWLVKDLANVGRAQDAIDLAKNMIELPRLDAAHSQAYHLGRERLTETLVKYEMWSDLTALENSVYLAPAEQAEVEARRLAALGVAYFSEGKSEDGGRELKALEALRAKARADRMAAADAAEAKAKTEKKNPDDTTKAMAEAMKGFAYPLSTTEAALAEVKIYQALGDARPDVVKPLLAEARDIPAERRARLHFAIGEKDEALKHARDASNADPAQVQPLANLAGLLWRAEKKDEARAAFEKLRKLSAPLDLSLPAFAQLAPIAEDLKLPKDWREPASIATDTGTRPDLAALGPFRWRPSAAPSWSLRDGEGKPHALADFKGKPVLVVFYLGSGCSHCIEQLNTFAPLTAQFADAGIQIIAVSTDSAAGLHKTFEQGKDGKGFPFPILADDSLAAFKSYRAFDDFENIPLHGTYLIDGDGFVRWQNISYQPFRDASWLLGESKRLLSVPVNRPDKLTAVRPPNGRADN
ncbi:MAG: peroxiredoxin family protein [Chthoniobacter sp.]|nr:peroxiredoxin family protein [Chthoniobacter sp.]